MFNIVTIIILFEVFCLSAEAVSFKHEGARVLFEDMNYIKDSHVLTYRKSRRSSYLTSFNGTLLQPWGDDITAEIEVRNEQLKTGSIKFGAKLCDFIKMDWTQTWLKDHSNIPYEKCPVPPGSYYFHEMAIPPKNFPIKMLPGDYFLKLTYRLSNKSKIFEAAINLKMANSF